MAKKRSKKTLSGTLKKLESKLAGKPGITIGRPIASAPKHVNNFQVHGLFSRLRREGYRVDENDLWNPTGCSIIAEARNMIVDTFLKRDGTNNPLHEYLLFIDDDQCFPQDYDPYEAVKMLIDDDKDIVGALTVRRFPPHRLNISMFYQGGMRHIGKYPKDEPFRVHQLGFGLVLIKRHVIERLYNATAPPAPLFHNPLQYNPMVGKVELRGEDYLFCIESLKAGFDIWVEPRIPLLHIGDYPFGVDNFEAYLPDLKENMLDICQDTHLYAELVDTWRKSGRRSKTDPVNLSSAASAALKQKETSDAISAVSSTTPDQ